MQFLTNRYPTVANCEKYAELLWSLFPPLDSSPPHLGWPLTNWTHALHLVQLGFSRLSTVKGFPAIRVSLLLADEMITSGFITQADPLTVSPLVERRLENVKGPWVGASNGDAFSVGYVKGAARVCALHTLVTLGIDDQSDLSKAG